MQSGKAGTGPGQPLEPTMTYGGALTDAEILTNLIKHGEENALRGIKEIQRKMTPSRAKVRNASTSKVSPPVMSN